MYIPDEEWDEIVEYALNIGNDPQWSIESQMRHFIGHLINLEDKPLPEPKEMPLKGYHKIQEGRKVMRGFTKYFLLLYAKKRINAIKKIKIKSTNLPKLDRTI